MGLCQIRSKLEQLRAVEPAEEAIDDKDFEVYPELCLLGQRVLKPHHVHDCQAESKVNLLQRCCCLKWKRTYLSQYFFRHLLANLYLN